MGNLVRRINALEAAQRRPRTEVPVLGPYLARHLALPVLRGFWPMSSVDSSNNVYDLSAQGRTLSWTSTVARGTYNNAIPYSEFNGSSSYLARADEAGLDVTTALTFGGWFWLDVVSADQAAMTKWGNAAARSYGINFANTGDLWQAFVSGDGTNAVSVQAGGAASAGRWYHVVGSYFASTEVSLFVDGVKTTNTTSVPASLFNSGADLRLGALGSGAQFFDGRATFCFLCAVTLPDTLIQDLYYAGRSLFQ